MAKRISNIRMLRDIDARMRMMDQWPGYQQVLTLSPPAIELLAEPDLSPELARLANDELAEICRRWPDKFPAFVAAIPFNNAAAAIEEIDRSIGALGARGIQMFTDVRGRPLDDSEFRPIFERMAERYDLPILLHPSRGPAVADYLTENKSRYEIWQVLGWPHDSSVALARLVFSGMMERLPKLKIISHHLGGTIPYLEGRVGPLWDQLGSRTADDEYELLLKRLSRRPLDYFRMFYADTVIGGSKAALRCGIDFFSAEHVLFASDCPFDPEGGPMFIRENMRAVDEVSIPEADKRRILSSNAIEILRLREK